MKLKIQFLTIVFLFSMMMEDTTAIVPKFLKNQAVRLYRWALQKQNPLLRNGLWDEVQEHTDYCNNKVTVVGTGEVGSALAFSLISQYVTDEIVLIGRNAEKLKADVEDFQDGSGFIRSPQITGGTDYALTKNSRICIVTAGAPQSPGQKREELVQKNLRVFQDIIPKLVQHNPNTIIIIVTNPVDIMTYITWKLVGEKNTYQIIGSGTNLDSSRLRVLIANDLHVSPESVQGWVIGEHGDSSVTAWSGVNVGGVDLKDIEDLSEQVASIVGASDNDDDWFTKIHKKMVNSAYEVIQNKGNTNWAVALSVTNIVYSILHNIPNVHAVSTLVKGYHGIESEVFLSLPCILGETGVTHIIRQPLDEDEIKKLKESESKMLNIINSLVWEKQSGK